MKRRYPLESLRKMRHRAVDDQALEVAERARRSEQARARAVVAEQRTRSEQARARCVVRSERELLEQGVARISDLQQAASWALGLAERVAKLEETERQERERAERQARAEAQARSKLASADAGARVVDKHREGWQCKRDAHVEAAEEEAAGEVWSARARRADSPGKR